MILDVENDQTCTFFKQIVSESADAIIVVDENQKLAFFNAAAEQLFGYSHERVLGSQ